MNRWDGVKVEIIEPVAALAETHGGGWLPMDFAPKDGTTIELLLYHPTRQYARSDAEREIWEQVVMAKWIDHNGGGWTWYGMCGQPQGWRFNAVKA